MGANDDLEGKKTHLAGFYIHTISGQNIPKPPIVLNKYLPKNLMPYVNFSSPKCKAADKI